MYLNNIVVCVICNRLAMSRNYWCRFAEPRTIMCFLWQIFDGHNGPAAAIYSKDNLLKDVMSCVPPNLTREEWLTFLPKAMVAGFVKTDKEWQQLGREI